MCEYVPANGEQLVVARNQGEVKKEADSCAEGDSDCMIITHQEMTERTGGLFSKRHVV